MIRRARFAKRLLADLPRQLRLAYCLVRDPRVPMPTKALFVTALTVIVTPFIDLPAALPLVGEVDVLVLTLLALRVFIAACPGEVVRDNEQRIVEQRSPFDEDLRTGGTVAGRGLRSLLRRVGADRWTGPRGGERGWDPGHRDEPPAGDRQRDVA